MNGESGGDENATGRKERRRMRSYPYRAWARSLNERPLVPDWDRLLHVGRKAVLDGRAATTPYLASVMWDRIHERGRQEKPVTFDARESVLWLMVDEEGACETLREEWGMLRAPETAIEAVNMLLTAGCLDSRLGEHRLTVPHAVSQDGNGEWAVGHCRDCTQPLLWRFPTDGPLTTWPFYEYHDRTAGTLTTD